MPATKDPALTKGRKPGTKAGFHGQACVQRAGAAQAAVPSTAIAAPSATYVQAELAAAITRINALTTLTNELRAALVEKGAIKGSA